jgi:hypothetical protein
MLTRSWPGRRLKQASDMTQAMPCMSMETREGLAKGLSEARDACHVLLLVELLGRKMRRMDGWMDGLAQLVLSSISCAQSHVGYGPSTAPQTRPALLVPGSTLVAPLAFPLQGICQCIDGAKRWVARGVVVDAEVVFSGGFRGGGGRGRHAVEDGKWATGRGSGCIPAIHSHVAACTALLWG